MGLPGPPRHPALRIDGKPPPARRMQLWQAGPDSGKTGANLPDAARPTVANSGFIGLSGLFMSVNRT